MIEEDGQYQASGLLLYLKVDCPVRCSIQGREFAMDHMVFFFKSNC
jgi:hypothetical protein